MNVRKRRRLAPPHAMPGDTTPDDMDYVIVMDEPVPTSLTPTRKPGVRI